MAEKQRSMISGVFLTEVHIQQRRYLTVGNSCWSVITKKKT